MSYLVTITEIKTVTTTERGAWGSVATEHISTEGYNELPYEQRKYYVANKETGMYEREIIDYRPDRKVEKEEKIQVYQQLVEDLDLVNVIKAVNLSQD